MTLGQFSDRTDFDKVTGRDRLGTEVLVGRHQAMLLEQLDLPWVLQDEWN
jgi:hypothetical protein